MGWAVLGGVACASRVPSAILGNHNGVHGLAASPIKPSRCGKCVANTQRPRCLWPRTPSLPGEAFDFGAQSRGMVCPPAT
eukprot:scaffold1_cov402-Prasinococcus_capsulatus_cf.AAC.20